MKRMLTVLCAGTLLALGCSSENESEGAGGSMSGMGGAGPGYEGSGDAAGEKGTVPQAGAETNRPPATTTTSAGQPTE